MKHRNTFPVLYYNSMQDKRKPPGDVLERLCILWRVVHAEHTFILYDISDKLKSMLTFKCPIIKSSIYACL